MLTEKIRHTRNFAKLKLGANEAKVEAFLFHEINCGPITPHEVRSSGTATVSCSATAAGEYNLTLTGASGSLTHKATATFNFVDFKIQASSPTGAVNTLLSSSISIIALNKFAGIV